MWKLIKISQQTCFINCNFNSGQGVTFILYDLKETWCQTLTFQEVKQKVKQLNKRYDFSEQNIKETLLNGDLETVTLEQQPHTSSIKQENCVVKLKYRIKNCPFNLEWTLRRQTLEEFQSTFMQPLFTALFGCYQQVEILTDVLRKKDAELMQYRKEGAVLNRKTLATKPFDFDEFGKKYQASTELAANYSELAKLVINITPKVEHEAFARSPETKKETTKLDIPPEEKSSSTNNTTSKMSPRQRKRKVQEMKQQQLERQLKVRKQEFQYESSQSQTTNSTNSQTNDANLQSEIKHKGAKDQSQKRESESGSDDYPLTPRRRITRCIPIKNYQENKSNVDRSDKSDSESDANNIRSLRERKTTAINTITREVGKSLKSDKNEKSIMANVKSNKTSENISKSPISNKKLQNSNNDNNLSTDSEYEPTSYERKTFLKTPLSKESRISISTREIGKSPNSYKNENIKNNETSEKISKSPISHKKLQNSNNVNDLSTDSEYEPTTYEKKTFLKSSLSTESRISSGTREIGKSPKNDKNEKSIIANIKNNEASEKISKSPISNKKLQSSNNVNDLSTDAEYEPTSYERKTFLKTSPSKETRKTRFAPQFPKPTMDNKVAQPKRTPTDDKSKNLSHSSTPSADDICSQLDAIKKELESLEALRLADLKQRMCKA